jgi:hypothetical protein
MQDWTKGKWGRVLLQTSAIIANCCNSFEMNRAVPGSTGINSSSIVILWGSVGFHRGSASIHRGSAGIHRGSPVALLAISYPRSSQVCVSRATVVPWRNPVVPGRAKDEAGKAIPSRVIQLILSILFHPESNAECSRSSRTLQSELCIPVVTGSSPDVYQGSARV